MKNQYLVEVKLNVIVTDEDIDDIMATALEGGINYWCDKATVIGNYLGEFASEQISHGGTLRLHDMEENKNHLLTRNSLLEGIKKAAERCYFTEYHWFNGNGFNESGLDTCMIDAEVADVIIQLAIFGDVIYG